MSNPSPDLIFNIHFYLSLSTTPFLILTLPPSILPAHFTGFTEKSRLLPCSISLIIVSILRCLKSIMDNEYRMRLLRGDTSSLTGIFNGVDTVLTTYFFVAQIAHLPLIVYLWPFSLPTATCPLISPIKARTALSLSILYFYSIIPALAIIIDAQMGKDLTSQEGFGRWWGLYGIEKGNWWRIVRPIMLLIPLVLTFVFLVPLFATLYANQGHPSTSIRTTTRQIVGALMIVTLSLAGIAYVIVEQVLGWKEDWWPRLFESGISLIIAICYLSQPDLIKTYSYWIRNRRPPSPPPTEYITHQEFLDSKGPRPRRKHTSSFFSPGLGLTEILDAKAFRRKSARSKKVKEYPLESAVVPVLGRYQTPIAHLYGFGKYKDRESWNIMESKGDNSGYGEYKHWKPQLPSQMEKDELPKNSLVSNDTDNLRLNKNKAGIAKKPFVSNYPVPPIPSVWGSTTSTTFRPGHSALRQEMKQGGHIETTGQSDRNLSDDRVGSVQLDFSRTKRKSILSSIFNYYAPSKARLMANLEIDSASDLRTGRMGGGVKTPEKSPPFTWSIAPSSFRQPSVNPRSALKKSLGDQSPDSVYSSLPGGFGATTPPTPLRPALTRNSEVGMNGTQVAFAGGGEEGLRVVQESIYGSSQDGVIRTPRPTRAIPTAWLSTRSLKVNDWDKQSMISKYSLPSPSYADTMQEEGSHQPEPKWKGKGKETNFNPSPSKLGSTPTNDVIKFGTSNEKQASKGKAWIYPELLFKGGNQNYQEPGRASNESNSAESFEHTDVIKMGWKENVAKGKGKGIVELSKIKVKYGGAGMF